MSDEAPTPATGTLQTIGIAVLSIAGIFGMVAFCGLLIRACRWGAGL
jgi:hypothetical protein